MAACKIVTIAMSTGAHAEQIGKLVAERLQFRYINEGIIDQAAANAHVSPDEVARVEHSTPAVQRILSAIGTLAAPGMVELQWAAESTGEKAPPASAARAADAEARYQNLIREVIWETARWGNVVLVAHGAGIYLAGVQGLLRVFITALPETRADRLAAEERLSTQAARKRIDHTDRERKAFLQRFYEIRQELPTHYDLVVNTDVLSPAAAVQAIVSTAQAMA